MNWIKKIIKDFLIKRIYQITTSADYIEVKGKDVYMNNELVNPRMKQILKQEAGMIKESLLYKSIKANRNYIAQQELIKYGGGYVDAAKATFLITLEDMKLIEMLANVPLDNSK